MSTSSSSSSAAPSQGALPGDGPASFSVTAQDGKDIFCLSGTWTVHTLQMVDASLTKACNEAASQVVFDPSGISRLDTAGALVINNALDLLEHRGIAVDSGALSDEQKGLLQTARIPEQEEPASKAESSLFRFFTTTGRAVCDQFMIGMQLTGFFGNFLVNMLGLMLKPLNMRWTSLVFHMEQTGLKAVPIAALLNFLIGMVVAYMGAQELERFGAQVFAVKLLEVTITREMGVLITAIVVAGRSSSSFTAQIGAMMANEEVAAIRAMGLDPMNLLVVPRVLALVLTLPALVFLADLAALSGGAVALWYTMDLLPNAFVTQYHEVVELSNFLVGLSKTPFFAMVIGIVGCFQGFRATGSSESVGFLTTIAVVQAIFLVILLDAVFALFFATINI